jgi:uncharacterized protein with ParB-like and HNH nuclease domain
MPDISVVKSLITPLDQTLRKVFNAQRSYFIDIYQREYKWTSEQVDTLLNDLEVRFQLYYEAAPLKSSPKDIQEDVLNRFEPYFLNTYLTHSTAVNTSVVDGQQRLTTLLLMLIKLYKILKVVEQEPSNIGKTFSSKVVEQLIFETNDFGEAQRFKIFNENRERGFRQLIEGQVVDRTDQTRTRLAENYEYISQYFDKFLAGILPGSWDLVKTTYYLTYLLDLVSIVEIRIERQDNVAMIFEVVNDRGLGLKPYEILKGKLIGGLQADQKETANRTWSELQEKYFASELRNTTEKTIDLDSFFRTYFRAKFANTELDYEKYEKDYHYEMYRDPRIRKFFGDFKNRDVLFNLIDKDFKYYAELYLRLRTSYDEEYLIYNKLLDQNQQYLLLLSNIEVKDPKEKEKIRAISQKFDQIHIILRLLDAYDSNEFQRLIYPLNAAIRAKDIETSIAEFDKTLMSKLIDDGIIGKGQYTTARELFTYERFKGISNKWLNFSKYVLMRIDRYLSDLLGSPSFASGNIEDVEDRFNRYSLKRYGMHLEHIYTQHPKNKALFTQKDVFDEVSFQQTRNLLGMVLLLKDKHNLSSNDEIYSEKCATYNKSELIWNYLLVGHVQDIDMRSLPSELKLQKIEPTSAGVFPREKVEERQKAIFDAIRLIWGQF